MRLGLIARADNRGLGQQTWAFYRQLRPAKTMVVDCPSAQPLPMHFERYPDATVVHRLPTTADIRSWLQDLDVVYTAETGYGQALWDEAERLGVRTVLHANYEFLNRNDRPTVWAAPSLWNIDRFPTGTVHLPVPVELDRFTPRAPHPGRRHFLHIVGRPAVHDRNGTETLISALRHVTADVDVTIKCQDRVYTAGFEGLNLPRNVRLHLDGGDTKNYWDNYTVGDVLVMPRRFGGLCLPVNEALAAGMPVIMPNIEPNNLWLPEKWLVDAHCTGDFRAKQRVDIYSSSPRGLAMLIDRFATDEPFYAEAAATAQAIAKTLSWEQLRPRYLEVLDEVVTTSRR